MDTNKEEDLEEVRKEENLGEDGLEEVLGRAGARISSNPTFCKRNPNLGDTHRGSNSGV